MRKQLTKIALTATFGLAIIFTSCGPSAAEIAIRSAPSVEAVKGLKDKLIWLEGNAQSGGNYILEIDSDEKATDCFLSECGQLSYTLSYKDKKDITITLKGIGANQTIYNKFNIKSGVTLILDDNITLKGTSQIFAQVEVFSGGTLVMNEGSTITGVTNTGLFSASEKITIRSAGVYVSDGGTFIMKGGTISGNTIYPKRPNIQAVQAAGIKEVTFVVCGSGVYVSGEGRTLFTKEPTPSGTFIKSGGTITGYASDSENGNVIRDDNGNVVSGFGHAVCFGGKEPIAIDTTVGPEKTLDFSNGILKEGRNE